MAFTQTTVSEVKTNVYCSWGFGADVTIIQSWKSGDKAGVSYVDLDVEDIDRIITELRAAKEHAEELQKGWREEVAEIVKEVKEWNESGNSLY